MRVLGISGSLRGDSHNTKLLRAAAELLPPGAELVLAGSLRDIPPFDEDVEHEKPAAVIELIEAIESADAVLISTPEYNHSIPGQLKNALDWVSRPIDRNPFLRKPVAVVGASTGLFGAVWAQAETRKVLGALQAKVLDAELPLSQAHTRFDEEGALVDEPAAGALASILGELAQACERDLAAAA
jgi:chromate reductase, NAD(P)H dehydrogenase (quinone)